MANVVFKWRITNCKYAYLTTTSGGDPFITEGRVDDSAISAVANNFSEEQYKTHYESMCTKIHADSDGKTMVMLDYKYYYNVDDTSCGLNAYGDAYTGSQGPAGRGIRSIQTIYGASATTLHFIFTDGTTYDAVIGNGLHGRNGLDGLDGEDGKNSNVVLELENKREELENLRNEILSAVTYQLNNLRDKSEQDLDEFYKLYSGLTHDLASATTSINEVLGLREYMNMYFHASSMTKTEFHEIWNPYSGFMETTGQYINGILSAVTNYTNKVDMANSQLSEAMSYYNQATGQLNSYWTKYDAINNRLENVVSELTGNSTVSLSEIYQTSREVGIMVTSTCGTTEDNPIMAAIVAKINDNNDSEISISADKIYMLGETVASALTTVDLTINDGNSRFYSDGSGYIANRGIYWDRYGNMTITGQLSIGDVVEELGDTDVTFGKHTSSRTTFRSDGSGSLASGNIYWDADGNLTIKKDAKIEGTLSVDEIADGLGNKIMSFGKSNTNATTYFYPDGSGSLAGGAISWDTDGSIKIAGDLTVGGSIIQEVIDKVDETDVNFGGKKSYFGKDGDGYLAGGKISWNETGDMKIDGTVTIGDISSAETLNNFVAALNVKDISINGGRSIFYSTGGGYVSSGKISWNADGSGQIANNAISWDSDGTLNIVKGTIGGFKIASTTLQAEDYSGDKLYLSSDFIKFSSTSNNVSAFFGSNMMDASLGGQLLAPVRIECKRTTSWGECNTGIYLSVENAKQWDDMKLSGNHALYIAKGDIAGFRLFTRRVSSNTTLSDLDTCIFGVDGGSRIYLTLPSSPQNGQTYIVKRCGNQGMALTVGSSTHVIRTTNSQGDAHTTWEWDSFAYHMVVYDSVNLAWQFSWMSY